jgi:hypothetical protein
MRMPSKPRAWEALVKVIRQMAGWERSSPELGGARCFAPDSKSRVVLGRVGKEQAGCFAVSSQEPTTSTIKGNYVSRSISRLDRDSDLAAGATVIIKPSHLFAGCAGVSAHAISVTRRTDKEQCMDFPARICQLSRINARKGAGWTEITVTIFGRTIPNRDGRWVAKQVRLSGELTKIAHGAEDDEDDEKIIFCTLSVEERARVASGTSATLAMKEARTDVGVCWWSARLHKPRPDAGTLLTSERTRCPLPACCSRR